MPASQNVPVSFEFFPPNTPVGDEKLKDVVQQLGTLAPEFFSVTYGAGGSTRERRWPPCATSRRRATRPRRTCPAWAARAPGIAEILATYRAQGIRRLVALRGDLPSGTATAGEFRYASELVAVRAQKPKAATGSSRSRPIPSTTRAALRRRDLQHFAEGRRPAPMRRSRSSSSTPTPISTSSTKCARWASECRSCRGSCRSTTTRRIAQFAARDGIEIPRWVALKMEGFMDDAASIRAFGLDVVTPLCERLIAGGAPGIHFYTLNQSALTLEICRRLGWRWPAERRRCASARRRTARPRRPRSAWRPAARRAARLRSQGT